ncbi:MAG: hypothetical protein H5T86_04650 [Armatimonadetes bacterium]|nr:hypothetical protein [Armatimonadota bacterium]
MRRAGAAVAMLVALAGGIALAQGAAELQGSVTLRGGQVLTGKIQVAELGVVEGAGIGNSLPGHGAFVVKVGDQPQRVNGDEVASVTAEWVNSGTEAEPQWEIKKLTIVKKDGTKIEGTPDWLLHASNVWVITADGQAKMIHAFPYGAEEFNPDNLIAKITIGAAPPEAPAAPAQPSEQPPAKEKPAETAAPATPAEQKPAEAPAQPPAPPSQPAQAPAAPAEKPAEQPPAAAQPGAAVGPQAAGAVLARDALILLVRCPNCGQMLKIIISADVVKVEHVSQ